MQFDDLENKIKEAAEQHHPAYDENAWSKMEKLLDQHLPQAKDDRRRFLLIFFLFLLIGGGVFIGLNKPWQKNSVAQDLPLQSVDKSSKDNKIPVTGHTNKKQLETEVNRDIQNESTFRVKRETTTTAGIKRTPGSNGLLQTKLPSGQKPVAKNDLNSTPLAKTKAETNNKDVIQKKTESNEKLNNVTDPLINNNSVTDPRTNNITGNVNADKNGKDEIVKKEESKPVTPVQNNEVAKAEKKSSKANKNNKTKGSNGFVFNFSAGPDVSKAGSSKLGTTTLVYGAGISYTRDRFTLKTGIYTGKKIYTAGKDDYKLSYPLPPSIKFVGANADCSVIEIPVGLNYNFNFTKRSNWFASAGLSSYLMKRETYNYQYESSVGYPSSRKYEVRNENKHYFSILGLSAGYTRQLNNIFSVSAEPYIKIPLEGIGVGKVHLNSGGILFTVGVKPFNNRKKK